MQTTSELYKAMLADPRTKHLTAVSIAGTAYTESSIISLETTGSLYAQKTPGVGCVVSREIELSILPGPGTIPRMAEIRISSSLALNDQESEPLSKGVFYIDTRKQDEVTGALIIHGYDALLLAEAFYFSDGVGIGTWPRKMTTVVQEICDRIGVTLDARTVINPDWDMPYPEGLTMREILGYVAACHAANVTVSDTGELYMVPMASAAGDAVDVGQNVAALKVAPEFPPFSKVQFQDGGKDTYSSGDDTGRTLIIECPWGTQEFADAALTTVQGYVYRPYEATQAIIDLAAELGDSIVVDGTQSVLATQSITFGALSVSDISAPSDEEVDHEIPFVNKVQKKTEQAIENTKAVLWTGIDQADHLSTSQKIAKYLREDTSEDDFCRVKGMGVVFIRARTDGTEVQATDEDGHPLYWDPDVEKATVEADGWYYVGTEKVKPTIVETPYPVMCYAYEEQVIAEWKFMQVPNPDGTAAFLPTIVMGAGTDVTGLTNNGKAFLQKHFGGIDLKYQTSAGKTAGAFFRDDGFVDVVQRRASISVDTANTTIVVRPEGELADSYAINYNEDEAGNLDLIWPDGYQTRVEVL